MGTTTNLAQDGLAYTAVNVWCEGDMGATATTVLSEDPAGRAGSQWPLSVPLEPMEREMLARAERGELLDRLEAASPNLQAMQAWGPERTVRAVVLRHLLIAPEWPVHARGVHLRGVRITGRLDLEAAALRCPLQLSTCFLDDPKPVLLNYASVPVLTITHCHLAGLQGDRLVVTKDLNLSGSSLELVSRGQPLVAGERGSQSQECAEQLRGALVAQGQPAVAAQPGQRALDHPTVPAQLLAALHSAAGNPRSDPPRAQPGPQMLIVIALVRVQLARPAPPAPTPGADRRNGLHLRDEHGAVMGVGGADRHRQRQSAAVGEHVQLGAGLAAIDRVRAGQRAPFLARTLAASTT